MYGRVGLYPQDRNPSVSLAADTAYAAGPLCRCATSPHAVGSRPLHKGAFNSPIEFILAPEESPDLHFGIPRGRTPWAGPPIEIKRPSNLHIILLTLRAIYVIILTCEGLCPPTFCDVE